MENVFNAPFSWKDLKSDFNDKTWQIEINIFPFTYNMNPLEWNKKHYNIMYIILFLALY